MSRAKLTQAAPPAEGAGFLQEPPRLTNTFEADAALRETLERLVPPEIRARLLPQWHEMGEEAATGLLELARAAQAEPPRHVPYDAWGRRVDEIVVAPAWKELHRAAARWGLTAIPYEGGLGPVARIHQFALLHLYAPSSAVYTCPLAMTDGTVRTLREHDPELARRVVPQLTTRDPDALWTSGQWMTERSGGSDVSGTETVARCDEDGVWRLDGTKWFTSAVTAEIALTLARPEGSRAGSGGLSLFFLETRRPDGSWNGIRINRLKDKLGTRALPTAELSLERAVAEPVGPLGSGVKKITPLLNTTRLHNAVNAVAIMARLLQLLRDYARRRTAFGRSLADLPLHQETIADLAVEYEAALALVFECARLLGRVEGGEAREEERAALRLLTPLAKLLTGKQAVAVASEAIEGFGGAGYLEDTGLPAYLRDAQVLPIWEGTTNVLSLDALRAAVHDGALGPWLSLGRRRLDALRSTPLGDVAAALAAQLDVVESHLPQARSAGDAFLEAAGRRFALRLASLAAAIPLAEQAAWGLAGGRGPRGALAARRWLDQRMPDLSDPVGAAERLEASRTLSRLAD